MSFNEDLLTALGVSYTDEEARNFEKFRAKVFEGLNITEYTREDLRNLAKYRAKLLTALQGGSYVDVSDTTAEAEDVAGGKYFYTANGTLTEGTSDAVDVSDTTAIASDVASGKYFYLANGTKTQGTASGGGGSSDYSTAEVTISNTSGSSAELFIPRSVYGYPIGYYLDTKLGVYGGGTATVSVTLYKGRAIAYENTMWESHTITVSGDITYSNGKIIISGDGTITLS